MAMCLKTGCDVFIKDFSAKVRADLHAIHSGSGDIMIIVNYNPRSIQYRSDANDADVGVAVHNGYINESNGFIMAPIENFDSRIYNYM